MRPSLPAFLLSSLCAFSFLVDVSWGQTVSSEKAVSPGETVSSGKGVSPGTEVYPEAEPAPEEPPSSPVILESGELKFASGRLHFLVGGPPDAFPVLLLHGQRFTSETWRELGTLDLLVRQGYRVLALDLPGYGQSEAAALPREEFLAALVPLLFERPVVVVSPSMSGSFSLPLVARRPSYVAGFVPVAPGAIDQNLESLRGSKVPALIIWGEKDTVISPKKADLLARTMSASRKVILPGASHPCYLDKPIEFHRELLQFLRGLS